MYKRALQGDSNINHVFFYETFRNYIFPNIFTKVLEYSLSGPLDYGWVIMTYATLVLLSKHVILCSSFRWIKASLM